MKRNDAKRGGKNRMLASILIYLVLGILMLRMVFAIPSSLTLQGKLTNSDGAAQVGTFNFTFKIYDAFTGGNALYKKDINVTTDSNGIYDLILRNISNVNFSDQYYLGITINVDNESEPRINLTSSPYSFRANISEALNRENKYEVSVLNITGNLTLGEASDDVLTVTTGRLNISDGSINAAGNLTLGERITFNLGAIVDNLVNGFLRINAKLNVTGNISIANNTLFVDNTSKRVGIGTTSPNTILDIFDSTGSIGSPALLIRNTSDGIGTGDMLFRFGLDEIGKFGWIRATENGVAQRNIVLADAGGNVGIGTTGPGEQLEIKSTAPELRFNDSDNSNYFDIGMAGTDFKIFSNDTSGTGLIIDQNGLVGIGTTTPDNKLTIRGTDTDSYLDVPSILHLNITDSQNTTVTNIITLDHLLNNPLNATNAKGGVSGGIGLGILFRAINNESEIINVSFINVSLVNAANATEAGALTFYTANRSGASGVESRLVPRLILNGTDVFIAPEGSGDTYINPNGGSVGIGNTSPGDTLDVSGNTNIRGTLKLKSSKNVGNLQISDNGLGTATIDNSLNSRLTITTNTWTNIGGRVGVGFSDIPVGTQFAVNGKVNISGNVTVGGASPIFFVDNTSSRVGIGTTSPINVLTVAGDVSTFGSLNATYINATQIFMGGSNLVQTDAPAYKRANYSDEYASTGFKVANVTLYIQDNASLIRISNLTDIFLRNYSDEYARSGFKLGNISNNTLVKGDNTTLALWNVSGTKIFLREETGNVGIGTTSPLQKLEVSGNVLVNNTANAFVNLSGPIVRKSGSDIVVSD